MARLLLSNFDSPAHAAAARNLARAGHSITRCGDAETLLEEALNGRPSVVVYVIRADAHADFAALGLLRRAAPTLPLILIATRSSLEMQREVLGLRPIYYSVEPVGEAELLDAIHAALGRSGVAAHPPARQRPRGRRVR